MATDEISNVLDSVQAVIPFLDQFDCQHGQTLMLPYDPEIGNKSTYRGPVFPDETATEIFVNKEEAQRRSSAIQAEIKGRYAEAEVHGAFVRSQIGGICVQRLHFKSLKKRTNKKLFGVSDTAVSEGFISLFTQKYLKENNSSNLEIDFLFVNRTNGIVLIEVKGVEETLVKEKNSRGTKALCSALFKAQGQLNRIEKFLISMYTAIYPNEALPHSLVSKIICTPFANCSTESKYQLKNDNRIDVLDMSDFKTAENALGKLVKRYSHNPLEYRQLCLFQKFAAFLISFKIAIGFRDNLMSGHILKRVTMLEGHNFMPDFLKMMTGHSNKSLTAGSESFLPRMSNENLSSSAKKLPFYWFNMDQVNVYYSNACKIFLNGNPGSGKTAILRCRALHKSMRRYAVFICPESLVPHYRAFIQLCNISEWTVISFTDILYKVLPKATITIGNRSFGLFSIEYDIYMDELDHETMKKFTELLKQRPVVDAETFVVGESPQTVPDFIQGAARLTVDNFKYFDLTVMMRSTTAIMEYYRTKTTIPDSKIEFGHTIPGRAVEEIECIGKREILIQTVERVRTLSKDGFSLNQIAVISLLTNVEAIKKKLEKQGIASRCLSSFNINSAAVTIAPVSETNSYEWPAVVVAHNYDHNGQLPLAVSRATTSLTIIKDTVSIKTTEEMMRTDPSTFDGLEMATKIALLRNATIRHSYDVSAAFSGNNMTNSANKEHQQANETIRTPLKKDEHEQLNEEEICKLLARFGYQKSDANELYKEIRSALTDHNHMRIKKHAESLGRSPMTQRMQSGYLLSRSQSSVTFASQSQHSAIGAVGSLMCMSVSKTEVNGSSKIFIQKKIHEQCASIASSSNVNGSSFTSRNSIESEPNDLRLSSASISANNCQGNSRGIISRSRMKLRSFFKPFRSKKKKGTESNSVTQSQSILNQSAQSEFGNRLENSTSGNENITRQRPKIQLSSPQMNEINKTLMAPKPINMATNIRESTEVRTMGQTDAVNNGYRWTSEPIIFETLQENHDRTLSESSAVETDKSTADISHNYPSSDSLSYYSAKSRSPSTVSCPGTASMAIPYSSAPALSILPVNNSFPDISSEEWGLNLKQQTESCTDSFTECATTMVGLQQMIDSDFAREHCSLIERRKMSRKMEIVVEAQIKKLEMHFGPNAPKRQQARAISHLGIQNLRVDETSDSAFTYW